MFINPSVLKKQLKKIYPSGVHIGSLQDGVVITNGHFYIWIDYLKVPNEIKAIIVEFIGIIPEHNSGMYSASKDKPFAQLEIDTIYSDILRSVKLCNSEAINTSVLIESYGNLIRIYQNSDFNSIVAAYEDLINLFDPEKCDYEHGETSPNRDPWTNDNNSMLYWLNDACKLIILPVDMSRNNTVKAIGNTLAFVNLKEGE